ncbi:hypothetical protein GA0115253_100686 [Streptomyces sp. Termitarium-T10T-6]|nr:hypothetical protein GA0115253_100686 [Streptomyces sp. Termitarium-T10T-6]
MMIAMLVITEKICGWLMFTTRMTTPTTPISTAGTTGVLNRGLTLASFDPAGRLLSRAMANISRIPAACTASTQTVIATTTAQRKISPIVSPSVASTTYCSPPVDSSSAWRSGTESSAKSRMNAPIRNDAMSARRMARGALRPGLCDSSPSEDAVSKPYIT